MRKANVPINCFFQGCYNPEFEAEIEKCKDKCFEYNKLNPNDRESQAKMLKNILGKMGKEVIITPLRFGVITVIILKWVIIFTLIII